MMRRFIQRLGTRNPEDPFERLDPRAKLIALFVLTSGAAFGYDEMALGLLIFALGLAILARMVRIFVVILTVSFHLWLAFNYLLIPLVQAGGVDDPYSMFAGMVFRGTALSVFGLWFALTTNLHDLTCALEKWHVPSTITLPFIITVRFIPTLMHEFSQVLDAMKLRRIYRGAFDIYTRPSLLFKSLLIPMLIRSLKMAEELAAAAETRGIGRPEPRTHYRQPAFVFADIALIAISLFGLVFLYGAMYLPNYVEILS